MDFSARERDKLFLNSGSSWIDASYLGGVDSPQDGRVVAEADLDHDGRVELIVLNRNAPILRIYTAAGLPRGDVLGLEVEGSATNRSAVGAKITARCGDQLHTRLVQVGTGFSTQNARSLPIGLGACAKITELKVTWPEGLVRTFTDVASDEFYRVAPEGPLEAVPGFYREAAVAVAPAPPEVVLPLAAAISRASAYRASGATAPFEPSRNFVYLSFWASWCTACKSAQPAVDALASRYGDRVEFAGVSLDAADTATVVQGYAREHASAYPLLALEPARRDTLEALVRPLFHGMPALPSGLLFDRHTGRVLLRVRGVPTVSQMEVALAATR